MKDVRVEGLARWAKKLLEVPPDAELHPVSDDASFRRYFRFRGLDTGFLLVDAPPEHEDNESFCKIAAALAEGGINSPRVMAADLQQGYMAVTDLGDQLYLDVMTREPQRIQGLYQAAVDSLFAMMDVTCDLPSYDETRLRDEMSLFHEWFLTRHLGLEMNPTLLALLNDVHACLVSSALEQPEVFVHRDYHCRNLMVVQDRSPGIIDFQDAVLGPVTYDLVSLYRDCYYRFETAEVAGAVADFGDRLVQRGLISDAAPVPRWFDLMGVQRHLKCAGIFARLNLRDGKPGYLKDIPLVIEYLIEATGPYHELRDLHDFLCSAVLPAMNRKGAAT